MNYVAKKQAEGILVFTVQVLADIMYVYLAIKEEQL
jgi:hypothetical protein